MVTAPSEAADAAAAAAACPSDALLPGLEQVAMADAPQIHGACRDGDIDTVQLVLEAAPAAAIEADSNGCLSLHRAAEGGHAAIVRLLLAAAPSAATSATRRYKWHHGQLPLHLAASHGHEAVARMLLKAAPAAALQPDGYGEVHCLLRICRNRQGHRQTMPAARAALWWG